MRAQPIARVTPRCRVRYERWLLAFVLAAPAPFVASTSRAATNVVDSREPQPFRVVFSSSSACSDPSEFVEQLMGRTAHLRAASELEAALTFFVSLTRTQAGVQGQLRVQNADGSGTTREVPGADCHEVLSAMALIGALMVDPFALTGPVPPPAAAAPADAEEVPREEARRAPGGWSAGAGQRLNVHTGVLPGLGWGHSVFVQAAFALSELFQPSLRVAALVAGSTADAAPLGSARFEWQAVRMSACPLNFPAGSAISARPCAFLDLGSLHAKGFNTPNAREHSILLATTGLEIALEAVLVGPLTLGAEAGVLLPLVPRDSFYFLPRNAPNAVPHAISAGVRAGLGLGLRFF